MKMNGPAMSKLGQGRTSWQWKKHEWLYSDLLETLKGFVSSRFPVEGDFNFCVRSTQPLVVMVMGVILAYYKYRCGD